MSAPFLDIVWQCVVVVPKLERERGSEISLGSLLTTLAQSFFQRGEIPGVDLTINLFQQPLTAAAGSRILLHLPIPSLFLHLLEPVSELFTFLFGEMGNGVFDGVDGHTPTIA